MQVHAPVHITASLLAGVTLDDGSAVEADTDGGFRITDASGTVLYDSVNGGEHASEGKIGFGVPPVDMNEILENVLSFVGHDAEYFEHLGGGDKYDADELAEILIFPEPVARWAGAHSDELSVLRCMVEEKGEGEHFEDGE